MIPNTNEQSSTGTYIGVPLTTDIPRSQSGQQPTALDYFVVLPALVSAATPLILGLKKSDKDKKKTGEDKEDDTL
ncbi:MAG TPA: hypothetical protein DCL61_32795 [Cyanobacteria bacterium UBA12227]|nr:hypothetical protein [Cyanobacteria bacterium UBA12227]